LPRASGIESAELILSYGSIRYEFNEAATNALSNLAIKKHVYLSLVNIYSILFLSKKDRAHLIGDLAEKYSQLRGKFSRRATDIWYYKQVITSIGPLLGKAVRWDW
jgi:hypothetical protein